MDQAKTIRIVYPANKRVGYANIAEFDYDPAIHTLWTEPGEPMKGGPNVELPAPGNNPAEPGTTSSLTVAKGARGLWFVKDGSKSVSSGFITQEDAEAAMAELAAK